MTTWSAVLVSSHACIVKESLRACVYLVHRNFTDCRLSRRAQVHIGGKRKRRDGSHVPSWKNVSDYRTRTYNQVLRVLKAPCLRGVFSWSDFVKDTYLSSPYRWPGLSWSQFLMEAPALPFISLNLMDGTRAAEDPVASGCCASLDS